MIKQVRKPIPIALQVAVYFRDGWLCSLCRRPTIFPFALKHLAAIVEGSTPVRPLAYYNANWRRDSAPLLDELGACIDHVEALAKGGAHVIENFATACARCNARKSSRAKEEFLKISQPWRVKSKHGEPKHWDGLSSVFVTLARQSKDPLTASERAWLRELEAYALRAEDGPRARAL